MSKCFAVNLISFPQAVRKHGKIEYRNMKTIEKNAQKNEIRETKSKVLERKFIVYGILIIYIKVYMGNSTRKFSYLDKFGTYFSFNKNSVS